MSPSEAPNRVAVFCKPDVEARGVLQRVAETLRTAGVPMLADENAAKALGVTPAGDREELGWGVRGVAASPVAGPRGNREIFLHAAAGPGLDDAVRDRRIAEEVQREPE